VVQKDKEEKEKGRIEEKNQCVPRHEAPKKSPIRCSVLRRKRARLDKGGFPFRRAAMKRRNARRTLGGKVQIKKKKKEGG